MDTKRVLHLINLLNSRTSGHEEDIAEIYTRALNENDEIARLKKLLEDYEYYSVQGNELYDDGKGIYDKLYASPDNAINLLTEVRHANESIESTIQICENLLRSPYPFNESISVLRKKDKLAYMSAYRMIASICVYLIVVYAGVAPAKNLTWNDNVGLLEMMDAVNNRFLPALNKVKKPDKSWVITRKRLGGKALFDTDGYFITYENTKQIEGLFASLHKEPMSTHSFLNYDAYETGKYDVPLCWGVGNIVSVTPENALIMLQKDTVSQLRVPTAYEYNKKMPTPVECVKQLSDGKLFCITPENLLLAMNQWQAGYDINRHRLTRNCVFCGKYLSNGGLICPGHFTMEL